MGRMTVTLDEALVEEARKLLGAGTKRETIRLALEEAIRARKRRRALGHRGRIGLDLDQDGLQELRGQS